MSLDFGHDQSYWKKDNVKKPLKNTKKRFPQSIISKDVKY